MKVNADIVRLLILGVLGALIGLAWGTYSSPKWEAISTIRLASISGFLVEAPTETIERLRAPVTIRAVLQLQGIHPSENNYNQIRNSTRVGTVGDSIKLRITAKSAEEAVNISEMYLKVLQLQQERLLLERLKDVHAQGFEVLPVLKNTNKTVLTPVFGHSQNAATVVNAHPADFSSEPAASPGPVNAPPKLLVILGVALGLGLGVGMNMYRKSVG